MAVLVKNKKGKSIVLLNPAEKAKKYSVEISKKNKGRAICNDGTLKKDKNGKQLKLSDTQKAWRGGYLQARKDNAKCFNAKKRKR